MKNKKAKKTYSSTKKKTSNAKIAVTVLLVFVLICGAIVGTLAAISDGFTKPVEDWFSDKATVTPGDQTGDDQGDQTGPGDDQGDQTGDEVVACKHVFEYGICTECGEHALDLISHATKAISADEDCIINYYDDHLNLIKSETVKGGDNFVGFEGYTEYIALYPSEMNVPNLDNVKDGDILLNGKLWTKDSSYDNSFLDIYPRYVQKYGMFGLNLEIDDFYGMYNDKPIFQFGVDNDFMYSGADGFGFYLKEGDCLKILYGSDRGYSYHGFVADGIMFKYFTMDNAINVKYDIDVVNVIVIGYDSGEVA